jgi:hypothetical protein
MSQRKIRRICALVALSLTLALAGPARAEAAQRFGPAGFWRWLEVLWQDGIGILARQEPPAPARSGTRPQAPEKNCIAVDPNGVCVNTPNGGGSSTSGAGSGGG